MKLSRSSHYMFIILLQLTLTASGQQVTISKLWETPELLTTSESVCFYEPEQLLFVSCINGNPVEKDGNGFISQVSKSGEIISLHWAVGLNAPKGMGIYKNSLYVTDIDRIVRISLVNGEIDKIYEVDSAKFLNDIAVSEQGDIYISDMSTHMIHQIHNEAVGKWFKNENLTNPNGLFCGPKELFVGTKTGIYSVRYEDKRLWQLIEVSGGIDGLEVDGLGNYIISDWKGKVQLVKESSEPVILLNTADEGINAADIEYIPSQMLLLVPTFFGNTVTAYELLYH